MCNEGSFNQSEDWLNELNQYIQNNKDYAISFIQKEIKDVYVVPTEATYLLWIDCHKVCLDSVELTSFIRKKTGLYVSDGLEYGENGKAFIRMNVACPFERLKDGLNRFKRRNLFVSKQINSFFKRKTYKKTQYK